MTQADQRSLPIPTRRHPPKALLGLTGLACVACCLVPALIAAGILGGAGWITLGRFLPAIAIAFAVVAAGSWWIAGRGRRRASGCGDGCTCGQHIPGGAEAHPA